MTPAKVFDPPQSEPELVAAVAAPGAEYVGGQAGGMQPHRNRIGEIGLAYDDGYLAAADGVPCLEFAKAPADTGVSSIGK
jgi:hypothetical protein